MTERRRVVCFGELLIRLSSPGRELLLQSPRLETNVGGAEANVAVSLARFGNEVAMASVVPDNALAEAAVAELNRHGVDTSGVTLGPGRMGLYFLTRGAVLRPSDVLYDRAGSAFALAAPDTIEWERVLHGAKWLHVSGITPAISAQAAAACERAVQTAAKLAVDVSFDGNYRERLWRLRTDDGPALLRGIVANARIAFINEQDVAFMLGRDYGQGDVVERRRAACADAFEAFPSLRSIYSLFRAARSVDCHELSGTMFTRTRESCSRLYRLDGIVDRIGTGDAFAAGVVHGLLAGHDDQHTLELATAAAVLKHSIPGDFNLLRLADVEHAVAAEQSDIGR